MDTHTLSLSLHPKSKPFQLLIVQSVETAGRPVLFQLNRPKGRENLKADAMPNSFLASFNLCDLHAACMLMLDLRVRNTCILLLTLTSRLVKPYHACASDHSFSSQPARIYSKGRSCGHTYARVNPMGGFVRLKPTLHRHRNLSPLAQRSAMVPP